MDSNPVASLYIQVTPDQRTKRSFEGLWVSPDDVNLR